MRSILLFGACLFFMSCKTRIEGGCPRPSEYKKKPVATIMKEANKIVSSFHEKRAVAFSIFGKNRIYTHGVIENIMIAKEFYPGWDVVIFMDSETVPKDIVSKAKESGAVVKIGPHYNHASARFFAANLDYDRFIVRDADSRIYPREVAAVADWIKNDWAILHGMRDAEGHANPLLGGMWGARTKGLREKLKEAKGTDNMETLYNDYMGGREAVYWDDEKFLAAVVVESVGEDHFMSHESIRCNDFKNSRGFPIPRSTGGQIIGEIIRPKK